MHYVINEKMSIFYTPVTLESVLTRSYYVRDIL